MYPEREAPLEGAEVKNLKLFYFQPSLKIFKTALRLTRDVRCIGQSKA
jgi:hypothetical protein